MSAMKVIYQAVNFPEDNEDKGLAKRYFADLKKREMEAEREARRNSRGYRSGDWDLIMRGIDPDRPLW